MTATGIWAQVNVAHAGMCVTAEQSKCRKEQYFYYFLDLFILQVQAFA